MELDSTEGTSQTSWSIGRRCKRGDAFSRPLLIIREAWPYCPSLFPPTIGCTLGASSWSAGGHSRVEIPVPIPNTEVKRSRADGTAVRPRESRSLPAFFIAYSPLFRVVFLFIYPYTALFFFSVFPLSLLLEQHKGLRSSFMFYSLLSISQYFFLRFIR